MFLQSYVVPVCLYDIKNDVAVLKSHYGTAFFINSSGIFLTAQHVLNSAYIDAKNKNLNVGLVVKDDNGKNIKSVIVDIKDKEYAPAPFDVAVGVTSYKCDSYLTFKEQDVSVWQDVATMGYPLNAVSGEPDALMFNLRVHKGYIQRVLPPGTLRLANNPESFELSFLLCKGLSGAPIFIHSGEKDFVIGVCVGSARTETLENEFSEIQENGDVYKEKIMKIEEFGIANDIRPLLSWKPSILSGKSLNCLINSDNS